MQSLEQFVDRAHLEALRKRLWLGREYGQAAVMIGAGFSRNADAVYVGAPPFPDWTALAGEIYDALYPPGPTPSEEQRRTRDLAVAGGALRLPFEYETAFGSNALDALIRRAIPDDDYVPGTLHRLLLELPWSDIFTTNYDTLLERTLERPILERHYNTVLTPADLPGTAQPRIIKLHGSFPSQRPFIVTEEHYRRFPRDAAPFVNVVQQSLMENALVLLGFSGEDPNFLQWIGWVRDHLGESAPRPYLCGVHDLSDSRRQLLLRLGVTPVDLAPLFPPAPQPELGYYDEGERHRKATEWLLCSLHNGRQPRMLSWPRRARGSRSALQCTNVRPLPESSPGLAEEPQPNRATPGPVQNTRKPDDLFALLERWRHNRTLYPGWVITPRQNRNDLWLKTKIWADVIFERLDELDPSQDLELLYELNWRLERAAVPLSIDQAERIEAVLHSYNPFPGLIEVDEITVTPDSEAGKTFDWTDLRLCWIELGFALARRAREDGDDEAFERWMERLAPVAENQPEWHARWHHEHCLRHLHMADLEGARKVLEAWPVVQAAPFWEVRRAAVLAEIGEVKEAEQIAQSALNHIRAAQRPDREDFRLFSEEGWTMHLLNIIKRSLSLFDPEDPRRIEVDEYEDRWDRLATYRCNPRPEIEVAGLLLHALPSPPLAKTEKMDTYTGQTTPSYTLASRFGLADFRHAFAFLRLFDDAALPYCCGRMRVDEEKVVLAATWIALPALPWAFSAVTRTNSIKQVEEFFDRVRIASVPPEMGAHLAKRSQQALLQTLETLSRARVYSGEWFWLVRAEVKTRILARFAFRSPPSDLNDLLTLTMRFYRSEVFRQYNELHRALDTLLTRIFEATPLTNLVPRLLELATLPIPQESGFSVQSILEWPEPFNNLIQTLNFSELAPPASGGIRNPEDSGGWGDTVQRLVYTVEHGTPEARERAVKRLVVLHKLDVLTTEEQAEFAAALWARLDPVSHLPTETGFLDWVLLTLPEPEEGLAKERLRAHLTHSNSPRITIKGGVDGGEAPSFGFHAEAYSYVSNWVRSTLPLSPRERRDREFIEWTPDEIADLLTEAVTWWDAEKGGLRHSASSTALREDRFRQELTRLVPLLAHVIVPGLSVDDDRSAQEVTRLLEEMQQAEIHTYRVRPALLRFYPDQCEDVSGLVKRGLNATADDEVEEAAQALHLWLVGGDQGRLPEPPGDLLDVLVNRVAARRQGGLEAALKRLALIATQVPKAFEDHHLRDLASGLQNLIPESALPDERDRLREDVRAEEILKRPRRQEVAAKLSRALRKLGQDRGLADDHPVRAAARNWQEVTSKSPFPELRRVFLED